MIVKVNNIQLPIESNQDLDPITVKASIGDGDCTSGWGMGEIEMEIDSGADCTTIPLPILKKILGERFRIKDAAIMETVDGSQSQVGMTKISLRIKMANGEVVILSDVDCAVPSDGMVLLGRNVLAVFKLTLVQNKIQSMILNPKMASWLGLSD